MVRIVITIFLLPLFCQAQQKGETSNVLNGELSYDNSKGVVRNIGDPFIMRSHGKYYLYGTDDGRANKGFLVYESKDLVNWSGPVGAGEGGRALISKDSWGSSSFWGAEVYERNGRFYMYYTVAHHLAIATSDSPLGPFKQENKAPIREQKEIDPHLFVDDNGRAYMYYVSFQNKSNDIYVVQMEDDWLTPKEETKTRCIWFTEPWENADPKYSKWPVTEGSAVLKHKGIYYLFYTANHFLSQKYAVGYATASSPFGPWEKYEGNPILSETDRIKGTGHCSFVRAPDNEWIIVYHTHKDDKTSNPRKMAIDRGRFVENPDHSKPDIFKVKITDSEQTVPWRALDEK